MVSQKTQPGSIVIFHINGRGRQTATAVPTILPRLRARGLQFVHLSDLLKGDAQAGPVATAAPTPASKPPTRAAAKAIGLAFCDFPAPTDRVFPSETTGRDEDAGAGEPSRKGGGPP